MTRPWKTTLWVFGILTIIWIGLTLWVQNKGVEMQWTEGDPNSPYSALLLYTPDPIYNFDEQICQSLADGLAKAGVQSRILTTGLFNPEDPLDHFDLVVFCANTYNWRPDWRIKRTIHDFPKLEGLPVVAITLGSGSTYASQRSLEDLLAMRKANVIASKTWWLLRPNDESRMSEDNVQVAREEAFTLGKELGATFNKPFIH